jgi:hypothetical protein
MRGVEFGLCRDFSMSWTALTVSVLRAFRDEQVLIGGLAVVVAEQGGGYLVGKT